jgi:thiosulfate/3-mercaptopyruvate sulfurtransferase
MSVQDHSNPKTLVSTAWLEAHLRDPDLRILDASWYLPTENRNPKAEYLERHIPGARFFDIDEISDLRSDLPRWVWAMGTRSSSMTARGFSRRPASGGFSG